MKQGLSCAVLLVFWVGQVTAQSGFYPKPAGDTEEAAPASVSVPAEVLEPIVRVEIDPGEVIVGEPVNLTVSILVPTWFTTPPQFPTFELENVMTQQPRNSARPGSEQIDGQTWTSVRRRFQLFPLVPGSFQLPGADIPLAYADPGNNTPVQTHAVMEPFSFSASVPTGAENLEPYIAGTSFELERRVIGETSGLASGDALEVEFIATVKGLPAIFIPQTAPDLEQPGVSVYPKEPVVGDSEGKGSRVEHLTLVFDAGGEFMIPGTKLQWWNTDTASVQTVTLEPLAISVKGPALTQIESEDLSESINPGRYALTLVLALLLAWELFRWWPRFRERRRRNRELFLASETHAYEQLMSSISAKDNRGIFSRIGEWHRRLKSGESLRQTLGHGGTDLLSQYDALSGLLYGQQRGDIDYQVLETRLQICRKQVLDRERESDSFVPALNPTS